MVTRRKMKKAEAVGSYKLCTHLVFGSGGAAFFLLFLFSFLFSLILTIPICFALLMCVARFRRWFPCAHQN
ncbi:hypothetical protein B0J15DRAFT_506214 [Fusarium solani]|uniref:Transmembrane protein n=1 Tax=Fusarium solani TaxID=169388 RepID=A0A9P9G1P0_FUSSL|nr:uncharacterized protein B0J15DRAFT_506214 [Fusarium solani]KAH7230688.1 hypothetical protein B0J15DRAFT_506214 [Fusarium solani]